MTLSQFLIRSRRKMSETIPLAGLVADRIRHCRDPLVDHGDLAEYVFETEYQQEE